MKKIVSLVLIICVLSFCFVSCGNDEEIKNKLCASEWEFVWDYSQTEVYEFNENGTYDLTIYSFISGQSEQSGTYTIENDRIKLVRDNDSYESELTYKYENNSLTLTCRNKTVTH